MHAGVRRSVVVCMNESDTHSAFKLSFQIVGCQPFQSKVMLECVKAGKFVYEDSGETLSDGTTGGIEEGAVSFFWLYVMMMMVTMSMSKRTMSLPLGTISDNIAIV